MAKQRAQNSDFPGFVRAHQGMIRAFLTRLTRDSALADDLAQDAFVKAHANWGDIQNPRAAKAWMFQIAFRTYNDHTRKAARRRGLSEGNAELGDGHSPAPTGVKMDIEAAMNSLSPDIRAVIMMCLSYGMSHSEASAASGLPLGTVKSHLARGRARLTVLLSDYESV